MKKFKKLNKKAFTLIEMLIVLVVVSLLMAIIIPNVAGQRERINEQARTNIEEVIETQSSTYQM
ncbi:MAG: prepilin-type N-terminal cleavage/methylation domain-containing protein, partial [Ruoffia tabacinasalis]